MCINDQPWFVVFQWIESFGLRNSKKKTNLRPQVPPPHLGDVALPDESKSVLEIAEEPEKHLGIWGWVNPIH